MKTEMKFIIAGIAFVFVIGMLVFANSRSKPTKKAEEVAKIALLASVDNPESVKILSISKPDSVFGRTYVDKNEAMELTVAMMRINENMKKATNNFENFDPTDHKMNIFMEQQMEDLTKLRTLLPYANATKKNQSKRFSGWKVKVKYEHTILEGETTQSEYWFILDKKAKCVVRSFEVPVNM